MSQPAQPHPLPVESLRAHLQGRLFEPHDPDYDAARRVFNAMVDKRPAAIVQCLGASDVINGINFAREHGLDLAVRGGGHSVAGKATCDGGLILDLSNMRGIRVDPAGRIAEAQPGATLGDFDRETHTFGLATTLGIVSRTGIAGLTLGGGIGWLNGKYGLACDNLLSLDVIASDGKFLSASHTDNEDLFWALRGGGGNFGVVTSFRYKLHPISTVFAGMVIHPLSHGKQVLRFYDEFSRTAPDELSLAGAVLTGPDGNSIVAIAACFCGPVEAGERALKPLRSFGPPLADTFRPLPYPDLQKMLDGAFQPGFNHYWKASFLRAVSPETAEKIVEYMTNKPSPNTVVTIQQLHGAAASVPVNASAFAHRAPLHDFGILSIWPNAGDSRKNVQWTRDFHSAMEPFLEEGVYVNNLGEEGEDRIRAAYGENYTRLQAIKKKYDPENIFHHNQNIRPSE